MSYRTPPPEWRYDDSDYRQSNITTGHSVRVFDSIRVQLGIIDASNEYRRGNEQLDIRIIGPAIDQPLQGRITKKARKQK